MNRRWQDSLVMKVALIELRRRGEGTPSDVAGWVRSGKNYIGSMLKKAFDDGAVHIPRWQWESGPWTPVYVYGPGESVPRPKGKPRKEYTQARRDMLKAVYGKTIARKILNSKECGVDQVVINGRTIYRRRISVAGQVVFA